MHGIELKYGRHIINYHHTSCINFLSIGLNNSFVGLQIYIYIYREREERWVLWNTIYISENNLTGFC